LKVNTKTRYGLRAMVEIANNHSAEGIYQKDISKNQDISNKYLDHIIHGLKVANLIRRKGKKGGYILTKKPSEITVYDIYNAFEPNLCVIECLDNNIVCDREKGCEAKGFWSKLNKLIIDYYKSVTLSDLMHQREQLEDIH
jgi:Rrf2 family protein